MSAFDELRTKGNEKFKNGNYGGALLHYTQCIDLNPQAYALYCNRAAALIKLDSMEEAKEDLQKSLEINPHYIPSLCRLGFILLYEGNTIEALENYVRAILICSRERSQLERFKSQLKEAVRLAENRLIDQEQRTSTQTISEESQPWSTIHLNLQQLQPLQRM
ncbi:unnamed protein product [Ambrosiozyma monospora]|uniref:Unnamed protein product n=1 Tax=Ambrosiozyma monospora TaxID=43982 RepID=A0A9W6T9N7_AMBMO|nr:unnamed protein product [Ambrosiozyma monospora]